MNQTEAPQGTQAVIRAIHLLKAFSAEHPELSLAQLCAVIGLTKTTTHRLLAALESEGLVERNASRNTYHLGPAMIALGSQALLSSGLRRAVRSTLEELAAETGETTTLEIPVGDQMLVLDGVAGRHLVAASLDIGTRWPVHVTSTGKCFLAELSELGLQQLLRSPLSSFTKCSITDPERLRQELETIRERGFATAFEELEKDYVAVAAAFRGPMNEVEGVLSIGGPASRLSPTRIASLGERLRAAADHLSRRHRPVPPRPAPPR